MVKRSKGYRSKTRGKLHKRTRERGLSPTSRMIQDLKLGGEVTIILDPSVVKGQPHSRYHGKTGVIVEQRGRAYVVELRDGGSIKRVISRPEHLRMVRQ
ncbi:MAG: 50S ribosomal protein L21e [Candidatus Hodarchaeaceae archaeon]|nr:50S ribosomal protein L21e [Candidatus Hodarchaeaceae archaeon]